MSKTICIYHNRDNELTVLNQLNIEYNERKEN